jgi:hypothetical protein
LQKQLDFDTPVAPLDSPSTFQNSAQLALASPLPANQKTLGMSQGLSVLEVVGLAKVWLNQLEKPSDILVQ